MLDLYVTGVDENSDKIFVTTGLTATMNCLGYSTGIYKPIETGAVAVSGFVQSSDLNFIRFIDPYIKTYYSYIFKAKTSPLLAGASENIIIEKNIILRDYQHIQNINECLVVDGVSGLASPLSKNFLEEDMIKSLDLPLLMVASAQHTSINNIILPINHAKENGINIRGIILSNFPQNCDDINIKLLPRLIEEYTGVKILGILPTFEKTVNPNDLIAEILNGVDIEGVFQVKIAKLQL